MKRTLQITVSVSLMTLAVWWAGPREAAALARSADSRWLVVMALVQIFVVSVGVVKMMVLTRAVAPLIRGRAIRKSYLRSFAVGMFAPGKLGELSYAYFLSRAGTGYGLGLAVMLFDKAVSFSSTALVGSAAVAYFVGGREAALAALAAVAIVTVAAGTLSHGGLRRLVRERLLRSYEARFSGFFGYLKAIAANHRAAVVIIVILSAVRVLLQGTSLYFGFWGFQADLDLWPIVGIMAMVQLLGSIPISFSGLGLAHGSAVVLFSQFCDVEKAAVLNVYLAASLVAYGLAALCWLIGGSEGRIPRNGAGA